MIDTEWNIEEVKHLKKKQLIQSNLVMLLLCILFVLYALDGGTFTVLVGSICVLLWILVANGIYTLLTGKTMGTKTVQRLLAFDIEHIGKKRWNRRKLIEITMFLVITLTITVILFTINFGSKNLDLTVSGFPLFGGWIGMNIGQISRIKSLS